MAYRYSGVRRSGPCNEDEIRSVEGPDAGRGGPEGTALHSSVDPRLRALITVDVGK